MIPKFTYEQAVLLSRIKPEKEYDKLCIHYDCSNCPAFPNSTVTDFNNCPFIIPYNANYGTASRLVRSDMKAQFPPEQYPELYMQYQHEISLQFFTLRQIPHLITQSQTTPIVTGKQIGRAHV